MGDISEVGRGRVKVDVLPDLAGSVLVPIGPRRRRVEKDNSRLITALSLSRLSQLPPFTDAVVSSEDSQHGCR